MQRKRVMVDEDGVVVAVCAYAPGERQRPHTDKHSRISFLLRGAYREEGRHGAVTMTPGHVLLKSRRARHEDQFGDDGACIASLAFTGDDPFDAGRDPALWRRRSDGFALRHSAAFLEAARAGDARAVRTIGADFLGAGEAEPAKREAPAWLARLKQELEARPLAEVDVAVRAREAGAHPAHASRLFRRCFALSIIEHAQAQSVRRAIGALTGGEALSDIALDAGFYDQSHMSRVFKRVTGRTPGACRALLAAAAG